MTDLRAAAERLTKEYIDQLKAEAANIPIAPYDPLAQARACLCAIRHIAKDIDEARRFAEIGIKETDEFAADSDQPIDADWLRSVGAYANGSYYWHFPGESDSSVDLVKWSGGWNFRIHKDGHNCETRGELLRLCRALGIDLNHVTGER